MDETDLGFAWRAGPSPSDVGKLNLLAQAHRVTRVIYCIRDCPAARSYSGISTDSSPVFSNYPALEVYICKVPSLDDPEVLTCPAWMADSLLSLYIPLPQTTTVFRHRPLWALFADLLVT
jgi:hypothetical protein